MPNTESVTVTESDEVENAETPEVTEGTPEVTDQEPEAPAEDPSLTLEEPQELLAGKYKTAEDLEKAYKELEKKLGSKEQKESSEETTEGGEAPEGDSTLTDGLQHYSDLFYEQGGTLSDEQINEVVALGLPEEVVKAYVANASTALKYEESQQADYESAIFDSVGGKESYAELVGWARDNFSDEQRDAFDHAVSSGNYELASMAVDRLKQSYEQANGQMPRLIEGTQSAQGVTSGYTSWDEALKDIQNPAYHNDETFRAEVERKIARSPFNAGDGVVSIS